MKVLIVDDSAIMRKIIRNTVDTLGYDCVEAADGRQALDMIHSQVEEIGLVLLDWNMPVLDGYSTLEEIKQHPKTKHIPVMMVTTESERTNIVKAIRAGAQHYVTKPFAQEDLLTRMLECLEGSATLV
jgi:two-component system chemotaxis response regulator CheY